ncbi:MAG: hypothetical protein EOP05_14540 [Proteobacteria bacterium]|nr:MAG: hypothetical protein EOP05_14540 [Pseudomonadota bacterium]
MKTSFFALAALLMMANVAHADHSKARMDEAFRATCTTEIKGTKLTLELFETTGDKGEPYGTGRFTHTFGLSKADIKAMGPVASADRGKMNEGNALFTDKGQTRLVELFIINNPAEKFAEFEIQKNGPFEVEISGIMLHGQSKSIFKCEAPAKPPISERDLY